MPRLLTTFLISLAVVVGVIAHAPVAQAADCGGPLQPTCPTAVDQLIATPPTGDGRGVVTAPAPSLVDTMTAQDIKTTSGISTTPAPPGEPMNEGLAKVMIGVMTLFAWLLGVAVIILDNAVYYTVVTMGNVVNHLSAIGVAWRILRDIANIALIFGFLAVGISTILDSDLYGWSGKLIPKLLMAAVFLNFSLFFTEAVIDVGNMFATQFYTQINGGNPAGAKDITSWSAIKNDGIANKIMGQLGLATVYGDAMKTDGIYKATPSFIVAFMSIILFMITAFVMFTLAFILIARFVILVLLIVVAPIGFAGYAVPKLEFISKKWSDMLIKQTITAPVLLLSLYIALAVITDTQFLSGFGAANASGWTGYLAGGSLTNFAGIILSFAVAIGLLLGVIIVSNQLKTFGGDWAMKWGAKASFGAAAWGSRAAIGTGIGRGLLGNRFITRGAVSDNRFIRTGSRFLAFGGRQLQNRTYDARNIPGASSGLGKFGVNPGKASTMTAKDAQEGGYGYKSTAAWFRNSSKTYEKNKKDLDRKTNLATPSYDPKSDFAKTVKKMSADDLSELRGIRTGQPEFVAALSPTKYEELQKGDKLLQSEKDALKKTWDKQFKNDADAATALGRFTTDEIASLGQTLVTNTHVANALGTTELDAIQNKGTLNREQRRTMMGLIGLAPGGSTLAAAATDYFSATNDVGGKRMKYWNV